MSPSMEAAPRATKRILIVDDEPDVVSYLEMLLQDNGYDTLTAEDGAQGLDLARKEKPDLVTLDISMPKASGTRFYKAIRSEPDLASIPVVIVTGVTGHGGDAYAYERFIGRRTLVPPPDGYFPKPIDRDEFLAALRKLLAS